MKKQIWLITLASIILMSSCAKEESESIETIQDRLLKSYISVVHLDTLQPTALGYYVIKISEGTGATPQIGDWVKWDQTQLSLDETVITTTEEVVARQHGMYNPYMQTVHYIPNYGYLDEAYIFRVFADAFPNMKEGAKYRLIVPARLLSSTSSSQSTGYASYILDVTLREVIESPQEYEFNEVLAYRSLYYPEIAIDDSIKYGMYYKTTYVAPDTVWTVDNEGNPLEIIKDTATAYEGVTVYVTYVGRFLDGFVFDTNIIDSAKAHNIYNPSRSYDTLSFVIKGGTVVEGFDRIVQQLKSGDKGIGFFTSEWGYGIMGSDPNSSSGGYYEEATSTASTIIMPFTPLCFDVTLHRITK